jgi:hypothetical protein
MNEEELKKGCGKQQGRGLNFYICGDLLMNVLCPTCQARLEGFQKGKLEQKKEELDFLEYFERCSKNIGSIQIIINRLSYNVEQRIKQLQKEIGEEKELE